MILEVQHETRLAYTEPVAESVAEVRMEPVSDADQSCRSFHLAVSPPAEVVPLPGRLRQPRPHFNVLPHPREVRDPGRQRRRDAPPAARPGRCDRPLPARPRRRGPGGARLPAASRPGPADARGWQPLLDALRPQPGTPLGELVVTASAGYIHEPLRVRARRDPGQFADRRRAEQGKGVCQDFTHLMIAVLRSFGGAGPVRQRLHPPARTRSRRATPGARSWLPDLGWVGIDPTNDCSVDEQFVKVAVGRDFTDVPPNKGVYRGRAQRDRSPVRVETRDWTAALAVVAGAAAAAGRPAQGDPAPPRTFPGRGHEGQQQQ